MEAGARDFFSYRDRARFLASVFGISVISPQPLNRFGQNFDKIIGEVKYTYPTDISMPNGSFSQRRPSGAILYSNPQAYV